MLAKINDGLMHLAVDIDSVSAFPGNPRRGDVRTIAESLDMTGQYRPIVVQRSTGWIVKGNHTWQAARSLGWTHIAALTIDLDDSQARRVVAADNRASQLGGYDDSALLTLLDGLSSLDGSGYTDLDVEWIRSQLAEPLVFDPPAPAAPAERVAPAEPDGVAWVVAGAVRWSCSTERFAAWVANTGVPQDAGAVNELRARLRLPEPGRKRRRKAQRPDFGGGPLPAARALDGVEWVPADSLRMYPGNPRQGDVGAVMDLLFRHGWYQGLIVQRSTSTILAGNTTYVAARNLGYESVPVVCVDVDDETAARIVAVDNRAADLGVFDTAALVELLAGLDGLDGTGYGADDFAGLLAALDAVDAPAGALAVVTVSCRDLGVRWRVRCDPGAWEGWVAGLGADPVGELCARLQFVADEG